MASLNLSCATKQVEQFPWDVVNGLAKGLPYVLRRVEANLLLQVEMRVPRCGTMYSPLDPDEYESYFRRVRSALPDLDKILITSVVVCHSSHLFANLTSLCLTRSILGTLKHSLEAGRFPSSIAAEAGCCHGELSRSG
jgi:hypothetical protein